MKDFFNAKGIRVYLHENNEMTSVLFEIVIQEKWQVIRELIVKVTSVEVLLPLWTMDWKGIVKFFNLDFQMVKIFFVKFQPRNRGILFVISLLIILWILQFHPPCKFKIYNMTVIQFRLLLCFCLRIDCW